MPEGDQVMPHARFNSEEIVQRGEELYQHNIRSQVEEQHEGKIIVIDIETGDYEIDESTLPAARRIQAKHPDAALYSKRIGYDAVYGFGAAPRRTKQ
jgi:hypothetical protein